MSNRQEFIRLIDTKIDTRPQPVPKSRLRKVGAACTVLLKGLAPGVRVQISGIARIKEERGLVGTISSIDDRSNVYIDLDTPVPGRPIYSCQPRQLEKI